MLWTLLGCDWPRLNQLAGVSTADPRAVTLGYEAAAERAIAEHGAQRELVRLLLERARAGDLRDFEDAARPRQAGDPFLSSLAATAAVLRQRPGDQRELL